ncbi:hypothetical protein C5S29_04080, partial [ANME-1 cluster archaeon GoMg3.2]|nr:hypothetical protein [ANME-1 cluster archaeon GoMg3.2]
TQWDWVELDVKFKERYGNLRVNMVLLVGNSLCLLTDKNDIKKSLTNIKSILAPGGVLLIDERNFDYILGDIDKILEDPISNFRYNGDVIYCGDLVRGVPTDKPEDKDIVVFSYYRIPQSEQEEMDSYKILERNLIGKLEMYPFKNNELKNLLESVGFVNIKTYSDFEEGYNKNADFFIYVAEVPST